MAEGATPVFAEDGSVVTVGTFDGLHRGHAVLIERLLVAARDEGCRSVVATFEPHPLRVVRPESAPGLLTTRGEKLELLGQMGVDVVALIAFTKGLAALTPEEFARDLLVERLAARRVVIGYDHGFGRDRTGDAATLRAVGEREGFSVDVVAPVMLDGEPVSSSRIRRALQNGDMGLAAAGLGRPYGVRGKVVTGDGRGRTLGFPTANLALDDPHKLLPLDGIYAVRADVDGELRDGVLHLGPRPTYPGAAATVELHLLDFDGDLYGRDVALRFCTRLRGIEPFPDSASLAAAIEADCMAARAAFRDGSGACGHDRTGLVFKAV